MLATVSDKKIGVDDGGNGTTDYFTAEVLSAQDYYPFGMAMPGRKFTRPGGSAYRYGFNGKENDNDVKGEGNQQDYGMRIYDPRLGRFLSVDPLARSYPTESSYSYAGNSPIHLTDFNGMFKISPYFVKKYPTLARMIKYYLPLLKDNLAVRNAWIEAAGYTNKSEGIKAFEEMVTYGEGPWITPSLSSKIDGQYFNSATEFYDMGPNRGVFDHNYSDNIGIDNFSISDLEAALKKNDVNEFAVQMFIVSSLIMHESAHWGKYKNTGKTNKDYYYEEGALWEEKSFGKRFTYRYPHDASLQRQAFDVGVAREYFKNTLESGDDTKLFGLSIFPNWLRRPALAPLLNWTLPSGTPGDQVLHSNKIKEPYVAKDTYTTGSASAGSNNTFHY